jgi:hypothetical protein
MVISPQNLKADDTFWTEQPLDPSVVIVCRTNRFKVWGQVLQHFRYRLKKGGLMAVCLYET